MENSALWKGPNSSTSQKNSPHFVGSECFIYRSQRSPQLVPVSNQMGLSKLSHTLSLSFIFFPFTFVYTSKKAFFFSKNLQVFVVQIKTWQALCAKNPNISWLLQNTEDLTRVKNLFGTGLSVEFFHGKISTVFLNVEWQNVQKHKK